MDSISRFLRGEFSLLTSYWGISVPAFILLKLIFVVINPIAGSFAAIAWVIIFLLVAVLTAIGVWNSATIYSGFILWKYIAKIHCVSSLLIVLAVVVVTLDKKFSITSSGLHENIVADFYYPVDSSDCNSPHSDKPITIEFVFDEKKNAIFIKGEDKDSGRQFLNKLDDCEIIDSQNWYCGGKILTGGYVAGKYQVVSGKFSYLSGGGAGIVNCQPKINIR